jgi:predicted ATPase
MGNKITRLEVHNFRSLADIDIRTGALNVLFGPNGAGKSTFLDTIWFIRDCAIRGVDIASSERSHGIGALWDAADENANISIQIETETFRYEISLGYSSGRIEPFVGESLRSKISEGLQLIERKIGSNKANLYHYKMKETVNVTLREPEKLALSRYLAFQDNSTEASDLDRLLRYVHFYHSRAADLYRLKKIGSESSYQTWLWERCQNLWSVLRNLHDRRGIDDRYDTIIAFMREGFPTFKDLLLEQTGPNTVYGHFIEKGLKRPIQASGVSDGHLQMLIHLTALFAEGKERDSLILFDEPEISLHPHALAIFAKAVNLACTEWNKQIFIATHSPVVISQFDPMDIVAAEITISGQTILQHLNDIEGIADLLDQYAAGSLYMAEMIASQSQPKELT